MRQIHGGNCIILERFTIPDFKKHKDLKRDKSGYYYIDYFMSSRCENYLNPGWGAHVIDDSFYKVLWGDKQIIICDTDIIS